ncbi:hypothetical protein Pth03_80520 [Planotetraspora thailandica]|uniref:Uncharacterized protein n=1 Tax=Planotetraspora thailandica TaxID=487172 RepID=A0A8J3Y2G1_9ACTN|nr:hypothetical protein [Planotetraspora thailandica]GII59663.1 hypothetical protein Pth03_80520 [Planotetraspora thailandica]
MPFSGQAELGLVPEGRAAVPRDRVCGLPANASLLPDALVWRSEAENDLIQALARVTTGIGTFAL